MTKLEKRDYMSPDKEIKLIKRDWKRWVMFGILVGVPALIWLFVIIYD